MYALTVKQPWAEAIARHGKVVENRTRRPPEHLLGQRIAIHVAKSEDELWSYQTDSAEHLRDLDYWMRTTSANTLDISNWGIVPNAGRIIATARLVGYWAEPNRLAWVTDTSTSQADYQLVSGCRRSPWFTGPVGWVLADVLELSHPVGASVPCPTCRGYKFDPSSSATCRVCDGTGESEVAIRGQVMPFELSAEVEAAVLAAEVVS